MVFRVFDHLTIKHLGRVNLIVGKNNVGKSSLLEAIWVYANQGSPSILKELLETRDEVIATTHSWDCVEAFQKLSQISEQESYLIRLENKDGKIIPTLFDEKKLSIVTREQIEVR